MSERQTATTVQPIASQPAITHPLDALLIPLQQWVETMESEQKRIQAELDALPRDIPHFVTRYP